MGVVVFFHLFIPCKRFVSEQQTQKNSNNFPLKLLTAGEKLETTLNLA